MKKIIYTIITNDCDTLKEPLKHSPGWDYLCLTDNPNLKSDTWNIEVVNDLEDPKKLSRLYKIKNHFPDYDLSIFIDATFSIKRPLDPFALSKTEGIWLNSHPQRQCLYEEAQVVIDKNLDNPETVLNQISRYKAEGLPEQNGLYRCGIMVRNPKDDRITEMCDLWWKEVENGSWRDQVSFPYACWKTKVIPNTILHGITQIYFKQSLHLSKPTTEWLYVANSGESPRPCYEEYKYTIDRYDTAHLIILKDGLLTPAWLRNYISPKVGRYRFIELVKILNGVSVYG